MNVEKPLISIIVPVYNAAHYLERCIGSLVEQTYSILEILLIDDGSTDCSFEICEQYAKSDSRIKVFHQNNSGVSSARNLGLKNVHGDYVFFVDADDWIHKETIAFLYDIIKKTDSDVAFGGCLHVSGNAKPVDQSLKNDAIILSQKEILTLFFKRDYSSCCNRLYRKSLLENLNFLENFTHGEDILFLYFVLNRCKHVVVSKNPLYYYFFNKESVSHSLFSKKSMDEFYSSRKLVEYVEADFPDLKDVAEIRVIEALSKLLSLTPKHPNFEEQFKELKNYVKLRIREILFNKHVYWKIRLNILRNYVL